jgi:plastocyanin
MRTTSLHLASVSTLGLLVAGWAATAIAADQPSSFLVPPSTLEVRMALEGGSYKFDPASITVRPGDRVRFVVAGGAPHNVAFDPELIPDDVEEALSANMPEQMSPLAGPLVMKDGDSYTISFDGVKPGTYTFFCMPHVAMGMRGTVIVK